MALLTRENLQSPAIRCPVSFWAEIKGDALALRIDNREYSYKELDERISHACLLIEEAELEERVAIYFSRTPDFIVIFWSLMRAAKQVVVLNPQDSKADNRKRLSQLSLNPDDLLSTEFLKDMPGADGHTNFAEIDLAKAGTILFSSGSTAKAKDIHHEFRAHAYSALGSSRNIELSSDDRWLWILPAYHMGGLSILFRCFFAGACIVSSDDKNIANLISQEEVTHASLVLSQFRTLVSTFTPNEGTSLKHVLLGGSAVPSEVVTTADRLGIPVHLSYGSTEMASQITTTSLPLLSESPTRSGQVLPYRSVKISESGEILLGGECLCSKINGDHISTVYQNSVAHFPTGDLGHFGEDGQLYVLGRMDNMFISGGENIHPELIEKEVTKTGLVQQCWVVPVDHEKWGFRPVALIQPYSSEIATELQETLEIDLAGFMQPDHFFPLPPLSKHRLKYSRPQLAEWATRAYSAIT